MTWLAAEVAARCPDLRQRYSEYASHGMDYLDRVMWDHRHGGFYWELDENGKIVESLGGEKHVYGVAFAIYAAATTHLALGDSQPLDLAMRAFDWLETHAHDKRHGGYLEALGADGKPIVHPQLWGWSLRWSDRIGTLYGRKSMNSHIHLLEAFVPLCAASRDERVRERLAEVFLFVRDRITNEEGYLHLYLTRRGEPLGGRESYGHNLEAAFLLLEAARVLSMLDDSRTLVLTRLLVDHTLECGWDETYGGFYHTGKGHRVSDSTKVWWTQAEGLNALLLMHELYGVETERYFSAFRKTWRFIQDHQVDHRRGDWFGVVTREGQARPDQPKEGVWKDPYHNGRALLLGAQRLRRLAAVNHPLEDPDR